MCTPKQRVIAPLYVGPRTVSFRLISSHLLQAFLGAQPGYAFGTGRQGTGYYRDAAASVATITGSRSAAAAPLTDTAVPAGAISDLVTITLLLGQHALDPHDRTATGASGISA